MDFRLENLSEDDFEQLINILCEKILGTGVVSFSKGKDGGRDGRFIGKSNNYPSQSEHWTGKFIIQAKHTTDYQASCSDKSFFGNKSSLIVYETQKVKELKTKGEIDNYLLFTNRKETEGRENTVKYIRNETGLENVEIIGKETINRFLAQNKDIVRQFNLDRFVMPFEFYDKDIRDLILIFHDAIPTMNNNIEMVLNRPHIEDKNKINNLERSYYENIVVSDLNRYHSKILDFLENPINQEYAQYYEETTVELKRVIETHRDRFDDFKTIFDFLTKYILEKKPEKLKKYRNTIPAFFHFMYYQCDIGREK